MRESSGCGWGGDAPVQGPFGHIASMRRTFMMLAAALCVFVMAGGGVALARVR